MGKIIQWFLRRLDQIVDGFFIMFGIMIFHELISAATGIRVIVYVSGLGDLP